MLLLLLAGVWFWREPLRHRLAWWGVLGNDAPPPDLVETLIARAPHPSAAVLAAWQTGKIVHRQAAVRLARRVVPPPAPLPAALEDLMLAAALDPDLAVREAALRDLRDRRHAALPALVAAQLRDTDPQVRLPALQLLKALPPQTGLPLLRPLLDDPEPLVAATALKLLEFQTGTGFGVKLADLTALAGEGSAPDPETLKRLRAATARARVWFESQPTNTASPAAAPDLAGRSISPALLPAPDFELPDLDGRRVRLSALRGRVVLLNFWATWCTACLGEIPTLVALQERHGEDLVILGIALDGVPDAHGHGHDESVDHAPADGSPPRVREKVARVAQARGINYPVLLDPKNEAGGRYQGGELPTTVIVDAAGHVRRRFIGPRSLAVFEALLAEAARPVPQPAAAATPRSP
jgi:thiol-disulfide isomerase/thioredoxin